MTPKRPRSSETIPTQNLHARGRTSDESLRPLLVAVVGAGFTEHQRAESLRGLAARLQVEREEERRGTSHEVHEISQALVALDVGLSMIAGQIRRGINPSAILRQMEETHRLVSSTADATAKLCLQLRPSLVDTLGLVPSMEWQAKEFTCRTGIPVVWHLQEQVELDEASLNQADVRMMVFRVFQHLLTNVEQHAGATEVHLTMRRLGRSLMVEVRDNGRGITALEIGDPQSLGLTEMRELAFLFGGNLEIEGTPGKGTAVLLEIPVNARIRTIQSGRSLKSKTAVMDLAAVV